MKKKMNPSTKTMVHLMLVLLSATVVAGGITNRELEGDEEHICFNGYVMDKCTYLQVVCRTRSNDGRLILLFLTLFLITTYFRLYQPWNIVGQELCRHPRRTRSPFAPLFGGRDSLHQLRLRNAHGSYYCW